MKWRGRRWSQNGLKLSDVGLTISGHTSARHVEGNFWRSSGSGKTLQLSSKRIVLDELRAKLLEFF